MMILDAFLVIGCALFAIAFIARLKTDVKCEICEDDVQVKVFTSPWISGLLFFLTAFVIFDPPEKELSDYLVIVTFLMVIPTLQLMYLMKYQNKHR